MRDRTRSENLLIPLVVTLLGLLRVGLQIASGGPWGGDATFGLIVLVVGIWALAAESRLARARST